MKHIIMNEEFADVQCAQIREYKYAQWFNKVGIPEQGRPVIPA